MTGLAEPDPRDADREMAEALGLTAEQLLAEFEVPASELEAILAGDWPAWIQDVQR